MSDSLAQAEALVREGNAVTALASLTQAVKAKPADAKLRIFLAQLLAVTGQWERAHTQLNVVAEMMPSAEPMRETMGYALRCELQRAQVFAGKRAPMVFGHPPEWMALLIESLMQQGQGDMQLSENLAQRAFEAAPQTTGSINGQAFEWIADADSRLGPVLEAYVNGRYYWIPFERLSQVRMDPPEDLRDFVWMPAYLTFSNGGEAAALIPTRYPGSERSEDAWIQLARKTDWLPLGADRYAGQGQRVFSTNEGDVDLMSVREIVIQPSDGAEIA